VHDFLEHDGVAYLVTELVDGGTLAQRLGTPLAAATFEPVVRQIAAGLDFAHQQGVLHRDVKPSNILLRQDGTPVVADFGLAKIAGGNGGLTEDGVILGTPDYMAPEQALGLPVDARTDVYSLGVIVYRMITGVLPFSAETPIATLYAHVHEPVPPVDRMNPGVSPQIVQVVQRALAKLPDDRYSSAGEFADALGEATRSGRTAEPTLVIPREPRLAARIPPARWAPPAQPSRALATTVKAQVSALSGHRIFWGIASSCATLAASIAAALALWAITPMIQPRAHSPALSVSAASNMPSAPVDAPVSSTVAEVSVILDAQSSPLADVEELAASIVDAAESPPEPAERVLSGEFVVLMLQATGEWSGHIATTYLVGDEDAAGDGEADVLLVEDQEGLAEASADLAVADATDSAIESVLMFTPR